jgi:sodium-dependent dicarboxylate transporter 2/3/5
MTEAPRRAAIRGLCLLGPPALAAAMLALGLPAGFPPEARRTAALALWMAGWWATEALPLGATALLPVVAAPALGLASVGTIAGFFMQPVLFLFLGAFVLGTVLEQQGAHALLARALIRRVRGPWPTVAAFMAASAGLSMLISNSATAAMLAPMAAGVAGRADAEAQDAAQRDFAAALWLGIAYAATAGGMATLVGSPPNALFAAWLAAATGATVGFVQWSALGLPVAAVMLPAVFLVLRLRHPCARAARVGALAGEAGWSTPQRRAAWLLALAAALWVARPLLEDALGEGRISDAGIAIGVALVAFLLPAGRGDARLATGRTLRALPWDTLLLFGGGLSLAGLMQQTGLAAAIGAGLAGLVAEVGTYGAALALAVVTALFTEFASNTATAAALLPVAGGLAGALGAPPAAFGAVVALTASCAFMLPVATPPNAIVFGAGGLRVAQMIRAGVLLDLAGVLTAATLGTMLAPRLFGG